MSGRVLSVLPVICEKMALEIHAFIVIIQQIKVNIFYDFRQIPII